MGSMKGQVFIIIALIVFIVIASIKLESNTLSIIGVSSSQTRLLPDEAFSNIRSEMIYAADLGMSRAQESGTVDEYVSNFTDFVKGSEAAETVYVISNFNDNTNQLNITVGNYLGQAISDVRISENLTGSSNTVASISDENSSTITISASPSETVVEVNVSFTAIDSSVYNQSFITKAGPFNYTTVFYDFELTYSKTTIREKFQADRRS